jgi:hypothetical protein
MTNRERVISTLNALSESELDRVARLLAVIRSRPLPSGSLDPATFGPLYQSFSAEDHEMAEEGLNEFSSGLESEDHH